MEPDEEAIGMDASAIGKVTQWIQENVGQQASKQELTSKAQGSDLPQEGKDAIQGLPEGTHSKDDIISKVKDQLMQKAGAGAGGMMGGKGGGMPGG